MLPRRVFLLPLVLFTFLATHASGTSVLLSLRLAGQTPGPATVELIAEQTTSSSSEPVEKRFQAEAPGEVRLQLEPGSWLLEAASQGFWTRPVLITLTDREQRGVLRLWPTGRLNGRLEPPDVDDPLPDRLLVLFQPVPGKGARRIDLEGETVCEVKSRVFSCDLPAGAPLDLRLEIEGSMHHYFWGVTLDKDALDLGVLRLQRGAAVAGWVVAADSAVGLAGTRLTLTPRTPHGALASAERDRLNTKSLTTVANDRGFFIMRGVPPGDYVIEALKEPFAPALASVRVLPDQLVEISDPPLLLAPPRPLQLYIDPPMAPDGAQWKVEWGRIDRGSTLLAAFDASLAAPDGSWTAPSMTPGKIFLRISDGEGTYWFSEEMSLATEGESFPPVFIDLPLVEVRGHVTLGDEPLVAELWFGGIHGFESLAVESDDEGAFKRLLPRAGEWVIEVLAEKPQR